MRTTVMARGMGLFLLASVTTALAGEPNELMATAAQRFLATLGEKEAAAGHFKWDDAKRDAWHYVPDKYIKPERMRYGLRIDRMTPQQRVLAHALLGTALSAEGTLQASTIMAFEQLLHVLEKNNPIRHSDWYYVSIFGEPSTESSWSWRFEGHHLSINLTIVDGKQITATPSFYASNPGIVQQGRLKGLKLLAEEEDLARALVTSLTDTQKADAIILKKAPKDIFTKEDRQIQKGMFDPAKGVTYQNLNNDQQAMLLALVRVYTGKYRPALLAHIDTRGPIADKGSMRFAWAGSVKEGEGHYYRVQTKKYLFEYDNTQNDAHHVHAVWREFDGDFGADLLRRHHTEHHSEQ